MNADPIVAVGVFPCGSQFEVLSKRLFAAGEPIGRIEAVFPDPGGSAAALTGAVKDLGADVSRRITENKGPGNCIWRGVREAEGVARGRRR